MKFCRNFATNSRKWKEVGTSTPTQLQDSSQQSPRNLLISESDTAYTPGMEAPAIDTSTSFTSDSPSFVPENLQNESDLREISLGGVG